MKRTAKLLLCGALLLLCLAGAGASDSEALVPSGHDGDADQKSTALGFFRGGELHSDNRDVKVEAETDGGEGERECA